MGLQFLIYYVMTGWMPLFLGDGGKSAAEAGWLLMLYQRGAFCVGFVAPALLRIGRDQRALAVLSSLVTALSTVGLLIVPRLACLWLAVLIAFFGISFFLAFVLIGMRTGHHRRAASLSTMSQAAAYLIAATGPVGFGYLHDITVGWMVPMASLLAVAIIQAVAAFGAGRQG